MSESIANIAYEVKILEFITFTAEPKQLAAFQPVVRILAPHIYESRDEASKALKR